MEVMIELWCVWWEGVPFISERVTFRGYLLMDLWEITEEE